MKLPNLRRSSTSQIVFHVETGDPSVGIFGEDFTAWFSDGDEHCRISVYHDDFSNCKFEWYSNADSSLLCKSPADSATDEAKRPHYADIIEHALHGFAIGMYSNAESRILEMEKIADECNSAADATNPELVSENRP